MMVTRRDVGLVLVSALVTGLIVAGLFLYRVVTEHDALLHGINQYLLTQIQNGKLPPAVVPSEPPPQKGN
jgi:hypothetical protein